MKRKNTHIAFILIILCLMLVSCNKDKNKVVLKYNGSSVPSEMTAELGKLFEVPEIEATFNGEKLEATYVVKDSQGNEIKTNNQKFRSNDLEGYTVYYSYEGGSFEIKVKVVDTIAPTISLKAPDGMVVLLNSVVKIPVPSVSDSSSSSIEATVSVKDASGADVTVTNNTFVPTEYGKYTVTYKASDVSENEATKIFSIFCEKPDLLNDFESLSSITYYAFNGTKELVDENANTGKGVKLTINDDRNYTYRTICCPLKKNGEYLSYEDLLVYDRVQLYVWISADNEIGLANQTYPVSAGANILTFSNAQIRAGYAFSPVQYQENADGFLINLKYQQDGFVMVFDDFIGIYPDDYIEPEEPKYEIIVNSSSDIVTPINEEFEIPSCSARELESGNALEYTVQVKDSDGNPVDLVNNKFTPTEVKDYTVTYTLSHSTYEGSVTINVSAKKAVVLNGFDNVEDDLAFVTFDTSIMESVSNVYTDKGIHIVASVDDATQWPQIYIPFAMNDKYIKLEELENFKSIQIIMQCSQPGVATLSTGEPRINFKKGINVIEFSIDEIMAAYAIYPVQYEPIKKGFYFTFPSINNGDEFILLSVIGIYDDDYVPTEIDYSNTYKIDMIDGTTILLNKDNMIPNAKFYDEDENELEYTLVIKDPNGNEVEVTDGFYTPTIIGEYTFSYSCAGFKTQTFKAQCKNGWILNDFNAVGDVVYVSGGSGVILKGKEALTNKSVLVKFSAAANVFFALSDMVGNPINLGQVDKLNKADKIQFNIYSTGSVAFTLSDGSLPLTIHEGWNIVEWDLSEFNAVDHLHATSGLITFVGNAAGVELTFDRMIGILPDDYVPSTDEIPVSYEPEEDGSILYNSFGDDTEYSQNGVYFIQNYKTIQKASNGIKITFKQASWSYMTFMLYKDGEKISEEELKSLDKLVIYVYTSSYLANCGIAEILGKNIPAGNSILEFTAEDLAHAKYDGSGFWIQFQTITEDEYIILKCIKAYYKSE